MSRSMQRWGKPVFCLVSAVVLAASWSVGCGGVGPGEFIGSPFRTLSDGGTTGTGADGAGGTGGAAFGGDTRAATDACDEPQNRKFVRISMRNLAGDHVHYFLVLVAFIQGETFPEGAAVCPDDVALYTSFGYLEIGDGELREFGNFCIAGPALLYFHEGGQFQTAGGPGGTQLASAIAPAQGSSPSFDATFSSGGAQVPVPDLILFHNPGTGQGAALKISRSSPSPCDLVVTNADADCNQDAFYYVDENDLMTGSTALGVGSGRRTPSEIQGDACQCSGFGLPGQSLAPSGVTAANAQCFEFIRGGRIEYAFVREDTNPTFPQLLWRVTDPSGLVVHDFDPRGNVP